MGVGLLQNNRKKKDPDALHHSEPVIRLYTCECNIVETELKRICTDILNVLDKHLIPAATTGGLQRTAWSLIKLQVILFPVRRCWNHRPFCG
uniref:Uncharacterized protein n=1 Tax=Leptobrachium leishanense TaxID=445787 RepID=A0A8C5QMP0_9ANUR